MSQDNNDFKDPFDRSELSDDLNLDLDIEETNEESSEAVSEIETVPEVEKAKKHGYLTEEEYKTNSISTEKLGVR